jgi:hypothetical protein
MISVSVDGFKELDAALKSLDPELDPSADRIIGRGLKSAAGLTVVATRSNIHSVSGASAANLKVRPGKRKRGYKSYLAGFGAAWYVGDQFYDAFLEFGHKQGHRRLGSARRDVAGEHPLQFGFEETAPQALDVMCKTMLEIIEKARAKRGGGG